jgi:exopolysaccharide biosynthesis operon protein EpsL
VPVRVKCCGENTKVARFGKLRITREGADLVHGATGMHRYGRHRSAAGSASASICWCRWADWGQRASCLLVAALFWHQAVAQSEASSAIENTPLILRVGGSVTWDSNVYKVPDSVPDPQIASGKLGKSDRYSAAYVGLGLDKTYSQQRIFLDAVEQVVRYDKFDALDRNELNYRGSWQWQMSPRISGTLRADRAEGLIGLVETQFQRSFVRTSSNRGAMVDGWLSGGWHLLGGVLESEIKNSVQIREQPDNRQSGGEAGLRYVTESQNSITFMRRSSRGTYTNQSVDTVNFIDSGFMVEQREVAATWMVGARHNISGRLTAVERRHEHVPQRDFAGNAGEILYQWTPTAALAVNFSALRNLSPWAPDASVSYRVDDTFSFAPVWRIGEKTTLQMQAYRVESEFLGMIVPAPGPARRDVLHVVHIAASWAPNRRLTLGVNLQRQRRSSTDASVVFDANIAGVDASLNF